MSSWLSYHMDDPGTEVEFWRPVGFSFTGRWEGGLPKAGELTSHAGTSLRGHFVNGLLDGGGEFVGVKGDEFIRYWLSCHMNGPGTEVKLWRDVRSYRGSWEKGVPHGGGELTWHSGSSLEGRFVNGLPEGGGEFVGVKGDTCMSSWLSCHMDGPGTEVKLWRDVRVYRGFWEKGVPHGEGELTWHSGSSFSGQFVNGLPEGGGIFKGVKGDTCMSSWLSCHIGSPGTEVNLWSDVREYSGQWKKGIPHGSGSLSWHSGSSFDGNFINGLPEGNGEFKGVKGDICMSSWLSSQAEGPWIEDEMWADVREYAGEWKNGVPDGSKGSVYWYSGSTYTGSFKSSLPDGQGTFIWNDGSKYEGGWTEGLLCGIGKFMWPNGVNYIGNFEDGEPKGEGSLTWVNGKTYKINWKKIMIRRRFWCQWGAQGQAGLFPQESSTTQFQSYNMGPGAGALNNNSGNGPGAMNFGQFSGSTNINQLLMVYCNDLLARGTCITK